MDSRQLTRMLGAWVSPDTLAQWMRDSHHALAWWAAQSVWGQVVLASVVVSLVGVFLTYMRVFFSKVPPAEAHAIAQARVTEDIRRRSAARLRY